MGVIVSRRSLITVTHPLVRAHIFQEWMAGFPWELRLQPWLMSRNSKTHLSWNNGWRGLWNSTLLPPARLHCLLLSVSGLFLELNFSHLQVSVAILLVSAKFLQTLLILACFRIPHLFEHVPTLLISTIWLWAVNILSRTWAPKRTLSWDDCRDLWRKTQASLQRLTFPIRLARYTRCTEYTTCF